MFLCIFILTTEEAKEAEAKEAEAKEAEAKEAKAEEAAKIGETQVSGTFIRCLGNGMLFM